MLLHLSEVLISWSAGYAHMDHVSIHFQEHETPQNDTIPNANYSPTDNLEEKEEF